MDPKGFRIFAIQKVFVSFFGIQKVSYLWTFWRETYDPLLSPKGEAAFSDIIYET